MVSQMKFTHSTNFFLLGSWSKQDGDVKHNVDKK